MDELSLMVTTCREMSVFRASVSIPKRRRLELKPTTESVVSTTTENVVKGDEDVTTEYVVIETRISHYGFRS